MAANVNVYVMADRTPITGAIVRPRTTESPEGINIFSELRAHKEQVKIP
jgi:hypothetical protein